MAFLKLDDGIELRSDESFRAQDHANHHRGWFAYKWISF